VRIYSGHDATGLCQGNQPHHLDDYRVCHPYPQDGRPGILEKAYFGCLCYELVSAGLKIQTQQELPLLYQGVKIDCAYRADLIVEESVIVELKAIESLAPIHSRQLLTYLRIAHLPVGLLLNFGALTMKQGIERVVNNFKE